LQDAGFETVRIEGAGGSSVRQRVIQTDMCRSSRFMTSPFARPPRGSRSLAG
jgi:hypothetical protein